MRVIVMYIAESDEVLAIVLSPFLMMLDVMDLQELPLFPFSPSCHRPTTVSATIPVPPKDFVIDGVRNVAVVGRKLIQRFEDVRA